MANQYSTADLVGLLQKSNDRLDSLEKSLKDSMGSRSNLKPADVFGDRPADGARNTHGFKSPREFMMSVLEAGMSEGRKMDKRLDGLKVKAVGSDEQTGANSAYGGFLIPEAFSPQLLKVDPEADPIGSRTRKVPMSGPNINIPARVDKNHSTSVSGGLVVYRREEMAAAQSSRAEVENVRLEAKGLFGLAYATEEILTDSPISFAALLSTGFNEQFTSHLIRERIRGNGAGEFQGVLTALDSASLGPTLSVTKETGQQADTIVYQNVLKMRAQAWHYEDAIWLANHDAFPQLAQLALNVGTGGLPVYFPSAQEDRPDMLLGRPIFYTEYASTVGDVGDLILGNWGEYLEGTYQNQQSDESIHVRFVSHERTFKFWLRNCGAPWWRSALTPAQSSTKLSPFVVLDAR